MRLIHSPSVFISRLAITHLTLSLFMFCQAFTIVHAEETTLPLWELGLGVAAYRQANYPGSDTQSTFAVPFPYLIYRGDWLRIDRSIQGILFESERLKLDISARGTSLIQSDEGDARYGMPDLDPLIEIGPSLSVLLSDLQAPYHLWVKGTVRAGYQLDLDPLSAHHQGWIGEMLLRWQQPLLAKKLRISLELGSRYANSAHSGYYYDVVPRYATPTRPAYQADGGYAGSWFSVGFDGRYERIRWSLYGAYDYLQGASFADSPLIETKQDVRLGLTISWIFWQSARRVQLKNSAVDHAFEPFLLNR
jgi:outer membrane scaffolding protein for murein synthesis (MipA/OmpV family)